MGWLLSLGVIIYLIYEFFKANTRTINKEAPRYDSYSQKGRIQRKGRESNNYPKSNQAKAVLNPNELVSRADALKKFADLRDQGIITAEEFNKKKEQILRDNEAPLHRDTQVKREEEVVSKPKKEANNDDEEEVSRSKIDESFSHFLRDIGKVNFLSQEQEIILGRKVQKYMLLKKIEIEFINLSGTKPKVEELAKKLCLATSEIEKIRIEGQRAREKMVQGNIRLVFSVAKKYTKNKMELLNLIQEGTIGLVRAVEKFDPERGYELKTYAYWWIRQSIVRAIYLKSTINELPIHATEFLNKLKKGRRELIQELSRVPTVSELAKSLEIPVEEIKDLMSKVCQIAGFQIEVGDEEFTIFLNLFSRIEVDWNSLLNKLPDSQCKVLKMRYGIDEYKSKSHKDIGNVLGISIKMVNTLEFRGLRRLIRLSDSNNDYFSE